MTKSGRKVRHFRPTAIAFAVASCFFALPAFANPTGPAVVNGTAAIHRQGNLLQITNSPNAIINWQSFSIGASEITRFIQQSAASAVLNRVTTQNPSAILGALQSNGRVFLINPSGILIGAGAQIDVAGLVASTLGLSNEDFLAGRMRFTEVPGAGSINNQGAITTASGGSVYLVGSDVTNGGVITSPQGEVVLAAGKSVELVNPASPNLRVEVAAADNEARNLGTIVSDAGRIGIYAGLVTQGGTVRADSAVVTEDGRIVLRATRNATLEAGSLTAANGPSGGSITVQSGDTTLVAGTVEAKGAEDKGGTVQLLGNLVGLVESGIVDVSGDAGGGTVLAGGGFQGQIPEVQNAWRTYVGPETAIAADAVTNGNGGKVIVWSDDTTRAYGTISAKGGAASGDGGFVEVSGKNALDFSAKVNASAANGAPGALLLDPTTINIANSGGAATTAVDQFADSGGTVSIAPATLDAAGTAVVLQATQDITVEDEVNLTTAGAGFVAQAGRHININAPLTTNGGKIHLEADSPHSTSGTDRVGQVNIQAAVTSNGGPIVLIAGGNAGTTTANSNSIRGPDGNVNNVNDNSGFRPAAIVDAGAGGINIALSRSTDELGIGATGTITQILGNGATPAYGGIANLRTTGPLVIGTATTAGDDGLGAGAQTLTVNKISNIYSDSDIALSLSSGSSFQLIAGSGGVVLGAPLTTFQTTTIFTTGDVTIEGPLSTSNHDLIITGPAGNLNLSPPNGAKINTGTGAFFCDVLSGCPAIATGVLWDGGAGTLDWFAAVNWSTNTVPTDTNDVRIGAGFGTVQIGTGDAAQARSLIADSPLQLSTGSLTLANPSSFSNVFTLSGGSLQGNGSVTVGGANGALTWNGGTLASGGSFSLAGGRSGTLSGALTLDRQLTNAGSLTLSGTTVSGTGSISNAGTITSAVGAANAVNVALANSGTLRLLNSLTVQSFPVNSGTINLAANNPTLSTSDNSLTNAATGVISGTGTLDLGGAPRTLTNDGAIRPGGSPGLLVINGNLVLSSSSVLDFELAGTAVRGVDYDAIDVSGDVMLGGTANTIHLGGFTPSALDTFQVIRTTGALKTVSGTFAAINSPFGFDYNPVYGLTDVNFAFAAVLAINEWNTDSSGSWDDPTKWTLGLPVPGQAIRIDRPGSPAVTMSTLVRTILQFENAETLTLDDSTLNITDGSINSGTLNLNNSTLGGAGTLTNQGTVALSGGTISAPLDNQGLLVAVNNATSTIGTAIASNMGTIRVNGAGGNTPVLTIADGLTSAGTIDLVADSGGSATLRLTGGTVDVASGGNVTGSAGSAFSVEGASVNLAIGSGYSMDTTNVSSGTLNIGNAVTMANLNLSGGSAAGTGNLTVTNDFNHTGGTFGATFADLELHKAGAFNVGGYTATNSLRLIATGGITLNGGVSANGSGDAVVLAGSAFTNNAGPTAVSAPNGRWLIYSTNPASDNRGGLVHDFKQYNAAYGVAPVAGTGDGFLYSIAPTITPSLAGTTSKVYDGTTTAMLTTANYAVTGAIDGDTVLLNDPGTGSYTGKDAGTGKTVSTTVAIASSSNAAVSVFGYQLSSDTASGNIGTITPAALAVTANDAGKSYDGLVFGGGNGVSYSDFVNGETAAVLGGAVGYGGSSQGAVNAGSYSITPSGLTSGNYTISFVNGTLTVSPAMLNLSGSRTYDGSTSFAASTFGALNGVAGETLTVSGSATVASKNVGTQALTGLPLLANGTGLASNYTLTGGTHTGTIAKAALALNAVSDTKVYDGTTSSTGMPTIVGLVGGDTVGSLGQAFASKNVLGTNGSTLVVNGGYVVADGNSGGNYTVSTNAATGTINPAALLVSGVTAGNKVYDATAVATLDTGAAALGGVIGGDAVTLNGASAAGAFNTKDVGTNKPVAVAGFTVGGADVGDYTLTQPTGLTADITPAALFYLANAASRERGDPNAVFSGTVGGFVGGETLATATSGTLGFTSPATRTSAEGQYAINGSGLTASNGNYTFAQAPGNATALTVAPPVNFTWTLGGGGAWETGSNWNKGFAPVDGAVVTIPNLTGSNTITYSTGTTRVTTVTSFEGLTVAGGALNLGMAASDVSTFQPGAPLTLSGGRLGGSGTVNVHTANWSGGSLAGSVNLVMTGGGFNFTGNGARIFNGSTLSLNDLTLDAGSLTLQSGTLNASGTTTIASGATMVARGGAFNATGGAGAVNVSGTFEAGGSTVTVGAMNVLAGGMLRGSGAVTGNVNNSAGTVTPGTSLGTLTIDGHYVQGTNGRLGIEIGDMASGAKLEQLVVNGNATLDGTLEVALVGGYVPLPNDAFAIVRARSVGGTFAAINSPAAQTFAPQYLATAVNALAGAPSSTPTAARGTDQASVNSTQQSTNFEPTATSGTPDDTSNEKEDKQKKKPICTGGGSPSGAAAVVSGGGSSARCTARGCY